jgi:hypothetical protein
MLSPDLAKPSSRDSFVARATASVMPWTLCVSTACTPHATARRRATAVSVTIAMMGATGRSRETRWAVLPLVVKAAIASDIEGFAGPGLSLA